MAFALQSIGIELWRSSGRFLRSTWLCRKAMHGLRQLLAITVYLGSPWCVGVMTVQRPRTRCGGSSVVLRCPDLILQQYNTTSATLSTQLQAVDIC